MNRTAVLGEVLESVVSWSRLLGSTRSTPFRGRQLSHSQLEALFLIAHRPAPMSPGFLARELKLTPGAVTQLLDGLRQAGLVDQQPHPSDAPLPSSHPHPGGRAPGSRVRTRTGDRAGRRVQRSQRRRADHPREPCCPERCGADGCGLPVHSRPSHHLGTELSFDITTGPAEGLSDLRARLAVDTNCTVCNIEGALKWR